MNGITQLDRQRAAAECIAHRCKALGLRAWAASSARNAVRCAIRDGRSVAFAVAAGVDVAERLAQQPGGRVGREDEPRRHLRTERRPQSLLQRLINACTYGAEVAH